MSEWKKVTLDQMGIISRGKSKHRPRNDARLFGGKYPFIQTGDIGTAGLYVTEYSQTYNEEGLAQSKLWGKDTLCITIAANIADTALLAFPACFPDSIMGFIPYENIANVKFVKYCFDILQRDCQQISQGTAQDNLSWKKLSTILFPCPPIEVQNKIATILSRYDSFIENYQKQIKLLEESAQRLYKEWFIDLRFPGYENTKIVDGVPEGWEKTILCSLVEFKRGKTITKKDVIEGNIPVVAGGLEPAYYCNKFNTSERVITISASGANAGYTKMYFEKVWASDCSFADNSMTPYLHFIFCFLRDNKTTIDNMQKGSAQPHVYAKDVNAMELCLPETSILQTFEKKVSKRFDTISSLLSQIRHLTEARDRLLPKLMSREIEVF
ncbi:MAG: restriction endonuclease subunit S [Bacteroidales bacterium]|nr:restriction endonuclease subunit S [Bacteroidales bacterium]